ncbi:serine/threonine-protein kinase [Nocardia sp. N2S4-5]|uniref:serine/threonine-protein kinase n=1 Tax=Nocardia sp. N2S4-5 TaxID=3351565 RepID=UPI0037CE2F24
MGQSLRDGEVFAGFRIERRLGSGGMGEVYLAHDRDLPRYVALKVLGPSVAGDPDAQARFLREADTAARLSHPNIVTVYSRGREENRLWMAMQYIEGTDVGALLRNGPIHPEPAVRIVSETAKALDAAHDSGILHRDVKPANILLANNKLEQVLLADFGIAKALDRSNNLTRTGELYASFQYAAPEQFDGHSHVDHRADVYALGCTLYHMVTGVTPYPGTNTGQLIHGHLNLPIPRPSQQNPWLPPPFDAVIARALAKNRDERFWSCGELAHAAQQALTSPAPTPLPPPPAKRPSRTTAKIAAGAAAGLLIAGATTAIVVLYNNWSRDHEQVALNQARDAASDAACAYIQTMFNYDYTDLEPYRTSAIDGATGDWKTQFESSWPTLSKTMTDSHAHSKATDPQCSAKSSEKNSAEVSAVMNGRFSNDNNGQANSAKQMTFNLTMEKVDARWLCSKLQNVESGN